MNLWFVFWVFFAVFILGTSGWSYLILIRQKQTWKKVAEKLHLKYHAPSAMKSPVLIGNYNGQSIEIFSGPQLSSTRTGAMRTVFQLNLGAPMPTIGAMGSTYFKNFIDGLDLPEFFNAENDKEISPDTYIRIKKSAHLAPYMTKERIAALNSLLAIKNMPAIILFNDTETVLRIECADPFDNAEKMERFISKITDAAKIISL